MKISESKAEQGAGLLLAVFSLTLYFVIIPGQIQDVKTFGVSPRFMPNIVAMSILILSSSLFISGYLCRHNEQQKTYTINAAETKLVLVSLLLIALNIVALDYLGYIITTILALGTLMHIYGQKNKKLIILVAVLTPLVIYQFFTKLLQMTLP